MSAGELVVVLAAVLCALGFAALVVVLVRVLDTLRALRGEVASLRAETRPLLEDLRSSTDEARDAVNAGPHRSRSVRSSPRVGGGDQRCDVGIGSGGQDSVLRARHQGGRRRHRHVARPAPSAVDSSERRPGPGDRATTREASRDDEANDMRRVTWFIGGVATGAAGVGYAKRKVQRTVKRTATQLAPSNVARGTMRKLKREEPRCRRRDARGPGCDAHPRARAARPPRRSGRDARRDARPRRSVAGRR